MAKGAAARLCLAVGTLLLTSALAAGAPAQGDTISSTTTATPAQATSADPQPNSRPGGRKGLFGHNQVQMQPQAYASLVGQPLHGVTGASVALPDLPQNGGVNVRWEVKLGDKSVLSGSGTVVPLTQVQPGTYTLDVTAADGSTEASGTCLLIVDNDSAAPVAVAAATPAAPAAAGADAAADAPALDAAATDAANTAAQEAVAAGAAGAEVDAAATAAASRAASARIAAKPKEDLPYIVVSSQHPVLLT